MGTEMTWGHHYAMVDPQSYRVEYAINPFMDPDHQPDSARAREQWERLVAAMRSAGARVDIMTPPADCPDMVYAMNLGFAVQSSDAGAPSARVVMSHMRYAERRPETGAAERWFVEHGFVPSYVGADGVGPHIESGDAFPFGGELLVGTGPRTELAALGPFAEQLGVRVRGLRMVHPAMYHLDLAFCPLDDRRAIVCPDALDETSATTLLDLVPEPLVITAEEAIGTFCANSIVIGRRIIAPGCPDRVREQLAAWGFEVEVLDLSEFHLGGGSIRCLTNPLDITHGRDLMAVPGGEVILPEDEEMPAA